MRRLIVLVLLVLGAASIHIQAEEGTVSDAPRKGVYKLAWGNSNMSGADNFIYNTGKVGLLVTWVDGEWFIEPIELNDDDTYTRIENSLTKTKIVYTGPHYYCEQLQHEIVFQDITDSTILGILDRLTLVYLWYIYIGRSD